MNPIERLVQAARLQLGVAGRDREQRRRCRGVLAFLRQYGRDDPVRRGGDDQCAARLVSGELPFRREISGVRSCRCVRLEALSRLELERAQIVLQTDPARSRKQRRAPSRSRVFAAPQPQTQFCAEALMSVQRKLRALLSAPLSRDCPTCTALLHAGYCWPANGARSLRCLLLRQVGLTVARWRIGRWRRLHLRRTSNHGRCRMNMGSPTQRAVPP